MARRLAYPLALACVLALALALAAEASAEVRSYTFRVGPISVKEYSAKRNGEYVKAPRVDGYVTYMDATVVDAAGQPIPLSQVMPHHIVFKDMSYRGGPRRPDAACPHAASDQRFYGTSEELRPMTFPDGYGYRVNRRDRWKMGWMLMNHTHERRTAYIQYRVKVDTAKLTPVTPYWFSVLGCGIDPAYSVPGGGDAGSVSTRAFTARVPRAGRIVAVGGHLHGGSHDISLTQPRCGKRTLVTSRPTYGQPDDPVYQVTPLLHEPDPLNLTWWQSATGIPVKRGEKLRVSARYRNDFPYMRVMGIVHVYIAHGKAAAGSGAAGCAPLPSDAQTLGPDFVGRDAPPHMELTLARMGDDGRAHAWDGPGPPTTEYAGNASIKESGYSFKPANFTIDAGKSVVWRFGDRDLHDATLLDGPRGFSSPPMWGGTFRQRFDVPGKYKIYCSLHPVEMQQVLEVLP
ncbi:MAG TPA: hypothetical protein VF545_07780 [Thermoleophilaceae bacterium]|jgi:plastocyanin